MRSKRILVLAAVGVVAFTSLITVEKTQQTGDYSISAAPAAEARGCCRFPRISVPRISFPRIRFPRINLPRIRLPNIGRALGNVARGIGKAVGSVAKGVVSIAKKVGEGVVSGVKKMAQGVVKIGQGVVQVAKGVAQVAVGVVKGAVAFTGGLVKAGGKLLKGDLKGAFSEVKAGASNAVNVAKKDIIAGIKNVGSGLVKIADGVKDVALGALEALNPLGKLAWEWLQKNFGGFLMKAIGGNIMGHIGKLAGLVSSGAGKLISAMNTLAKILQTAQDVLNAIQNPEEYVDKGKEWVAEKLTALAWRVIEGPIKKVAGGLISALVGFVKHFITTPLSVMLTTAIASVTLGIGALAGPLVKMAIDKLFDLAIDALSDKLAELAMGIGALRDFIKGKLIRPAIDKLYDTVLAFLKKKFPKVFAAAEKLLAKVQTVAAKASAVVDKVQNVVGKVTDIAGKIQAAAGGVNKSITDAKSFLAAQTPAKLTTKPKISISKLLPPSIANEAKNVAAMATNAKAFFKSAPAKLAAVVKNPALLMKILPPSMTKGITDIKNVMNTVVQAVKSPKKLVALVKDARDAVVKAVSQAIPAVLAKVRSVASVIKEEAPAGEVEVQEKENPAEAPVVTPAPAADTDGVRAAVKSVYSLMLEDWKSGLSAVKTFGANAGSLDIEVRRQLYPALVLYRRNLHDAARLAYNVRIVMMQQLYKAGLEEKVDAITAALADESAGTAGKYDGTIESDEKLTADFENAKNALGRLAQSGERFIKASIEVLDGRAKTTVSRAFASFNKFVAKARQGLEGASVALAPPPAEEAAEGEEAPAEQAAEAAQEGGGR